MKNVAIAITAVAGLAAGANGQAFDMVITSTGSLGGEYVPGELVTYSLYLDNTIGAGFADFVGWSSFAGRTEAPGVHNLPVEGALDASGGAWEGRRPPAIAGFPGGSGGGFRFAGQVYTAFANGLEGNGGQAYEGLAASAPLGGFQWDDSPRLEVFRGSFAAPMIEGTYEAEFVAVDAAYFNESTHSNTVIGVASQMASLTGEYIVSPAPGSLALLGLSGLAIRRRR